MDPLEEFLSPEALRLLLDSDDFATTINEPSVTTSVQSLPIITPLAAGVNIPIPDESKPTRKRPVSDDRISGCCTLVLDKAGPSKPKRARFNAEGRAKVASVRKKGACMKCHRNKIPCSGERPCQSCCRSRAVIAGKASKHRWMDCVPFSMKDLDIFAEENVPNDHLHESLKTRLRSFNKYSWKISYFERESVLTRQRDADAYRWRSRLPTMHMWKLSLKDSVLVRIDKRLKESLHFLIIAHLIPCHSKIEVESICNACLFTGSRLLQDLERVLSNRFLSGCDADTLRALITTIIFTAYMINFSRKSNDRQQQLLRVLAHHAVYIGERVNVWDDLDNEGIIEALIVKGNFGFPVDTLPKVPGPLGLSLRQMAGGIPTTSELWRDFNQRTLHTIIVTISRHENDRAIAQRDSTAVCPSQPNTQPEDRHWTSNSGNEIGPANSVTTAASISELQTDTVCGWCGSVQTCYKPMQGVVLCDTCLPQYLQNDLTASGWDTGQPESTDQFYNLTSGLDSFQGDSMNLAAWPDVTKSNSYGNDIDDFSWFMAS